MGPPQARSIASTGCSKATCAGLHAEARVTTGPSWAWPALESSHRNDYGDQPYSEVSHYQDSCSLLWIFFFSAQNSFMFSAPVFIAISCAALPPTTESQTFSAHRNPPQLRCSTPFPPHNPLYSFPSWALQVHGMLWTRWVARTAKVCLKVERGWHDHRLSSLQSPTGPFSSLLRPVTTSSLSLPIL